MRLHNNKLCDTDCCLEIHHLLKYCILTLRMEESSRSFARDGGTPDSVMCITSHLSFSRHNWTTATFPDASPDYKSRRIRDEEKNQRAVFSMFCCKMIWSCTICTFGQQPQVSIILFQLRLIPLLLDCVDLCFILTSQGT